MSEAAGDIMRTTSSRDAKFLYAAAFTQAFGIQQCWVALPYIIKYFDGTDTEAGFCLAANMGLYALSVLWVGRTQVWHYRRWVFFSTQGLMLVGMALILGTIFLGWFFLAAFLLGIGGAFFYISHLFYGASGGGRRFARMAIHEFTLSVGFVAGAMLGGYLSDQFGR